MRLTVARIERQLRSLLRDDKLVLAFDGLRGKYAGELRPDKKLILINPFNGCITDVVVHELLHLGFNGQLESWGELEETVTEGVEDAVVRYINRNTRRRQMWHRLIQEKLPDA